MLPGLVTYISLGLLLTSGMHKDELLQLHSLLCQVKRFFEDMEGTAFSEYADLEVSPQHIHKSKTDHKRAVFLLGKGLSDIVLQTDPEHRARLCERFLRLANGRSDEPIPRDAPQATTPDEHLPEFALAALRS